jgi:hypothetical protein
MQVDSGAFDSEDKLVFESCKEGVISVIRESMPNDYELVETIPTKLWAKTMAFDPKTKNIYLPTAEFVPNDEPRNPTDRKQKSWKIKPGSSIVIIVAKR